MCSKPPCSICKKTVNHRNLIVCAQCLKPIYLKCNNLSLVDGQLIKKSNSSWFCLNYSNNIVNFTNTTNKKLQSVFSNEEYHVLYYIDNTTKTCLAWKPQKNLTNLFNEFNNLSCDQNNYSENIINCMYYDIDEIQTLNKLNSKPTLSRFDTGSWSLSKNIEDLEYLLNLTSINFDVIAISERIKFLFECFLKKFNLILDKYLPLKKLTKQKLKFKTTHWITPSLQTSISMKNKLLTKFIKMKKPTLKNEAHTKYKLYKHIIYLKDSSFKVPFTIVEDNISLTNPKDTLDGFNNYFSNVATCIKSSIKYSRNKLFFDFLLQIDKNSFSANPTDKAEIKNIILSLDHLKSVSPNSISTKILKLLRNDISTQFAELFNHSSFEGVLKHYSNL